MDKICLNKLQKGNFLSFTMTLSAPSPILQCCLRTRTILPQHCTMGEGMREGESQFHPKIEFVQYILSDCLRFKSDIILCIWKKKYFFRSGTLWKIWNWKIRQFSSTETKLGVRWCEFCLCCSIFLVLYDWYHKLLS